MFGVDFEAVDNENAGGLNAVTVPSASRAAAYRGTISLKTLKRPKVKTLRTAYTGVDEEHLVLAEDAGLEELLALYKHDHAKVKALAATTLSNLTTNDEDEVIVESKEGFQPLFEMLEFKDDEVRVKATITLSILADHAESQEMIVEAGGWDKITSLVKSGTPAIQLAGLNLASSIVISSHMNVLITIVELREAFIKEGGVAKTLHGMGTKDIKIQRALATCLANLAQEVDAAKEIIAGFHLKQIIDWIGQGDEELTGSAITILANASNHEQCKVPLLKGQVLEVTSPLVLAENETIRRGALVVIANVSTVEEACQKVAGTCLDNVHKLAQTTTNNEHLYHAVVCFSNLASMDETRQKIKDAGIDSLLKALQEKTQDPDVHKEIIQALVELGEYTKSAAAEMTEEPEEKEEDEKTVKEELKQLVKRLVDRLEHERNEGELEKIAFEIQQLLLNKKESHNILWLKNGVTVLVEHINREGQVTPSQLNAIKALAELAKYRKNRLRIGSSQAIPPLLRHLKTSVGNYALTLPILATLESITNKDTILEKFRAAKPLESLMPHITAPGEPNEEVLVNCLALIQRTVKGHPPSQVAFRQINGFVTTVKLLSSPPARVREQAAYAIGSACTGQRRMQQAAVKAKAIPPLVALMQPKEDLRCRHTACWALGQIIQQEPSNQEKLRKQKHAVEALVELFIITGNTPDPRSPGNLTLEQQVQWVALNTAGSLCYFNAKGQSALRSKKAIPALIEIIKTSDKGVTLSIREQATRLLCHMCYNNSKNQELVGTPIGVKAIVDNLAYNSKRLHYYSEGLIWSLAHNNKKRRALLVDAGAIGALMALSQSPSEEVAKGAEVAKKALIKK